MAEIKTKLTKVSAVEFIKKIPEIEKRKDALELLKIFKSATGEKPKMWGLAIVGYGMYHYKSERSSQEGDWMITGFSPRKQNLTLYVHVNHLDLTDLLKKLGKYKTSGSGMGGCLYINKLSDVDTKVLTQIIKKYFLSMKKKYKV